MAAILAFVAVAEAKGSKDAELTFKVRVHDFGYVKENGGPVSYEFEFQNTGSKPLIIIDARARCGCTKPSFPKKPIKPGEKGHIKVTYLPKDRPGTFDKNVMVTSNVGTTHVRIKGNVIPAKK